MNSTLMRREALLTLSAGAALLLIGCSGNGSSDDKAAPKAVDIGPVPADLYERARKEGQLVIYASLSSDTTTSSFARAFNEAFPGITVKFVTGSASEVSARYESEAQANVSQADIVLAGIGPFFEAGYERNWFRPILSVAPHLKEAYPEDAFAIGENALVVFRVVTGFAYNTDLVTGENVPRSFADFARPFWKNRLVASDPTSSDTAFQVWNAIYKAYGPSVVAQINANIIPSSKKQLSFVPGAAKVGAGEAYGSLMQGEVTVQGLRKSGAPIAWVRPEVTTATTYILGISAKAPHPAAAQLFAYWAYSPAGQDALTPVNYSESALKGLPKGLLPPDEHIPPETRSHILSLLK